MTKIPKDTLAELLVFLAENEAFNSVEKLGTFSKEEVRFAIKELAGQMKKEFDHESSNKAIDLKKIKGIDKRTREILSTLSPRESKLLLRAFSIHDS